MSEEGVVIVPDSEGADLRAVGRFFASKDSEIEKVVGLTFQKLFELSPETAALFPADLDTHRGVFTKILRKMIELTRSCYLWPVSVHTGSALLPGLDNIRQRHSKVGVAKKHFSFMKTALLLALEQAYPDEFTQDIRIGFVFFYDVLAKSLCEATAAPSDLVPLSKFSHADLPVNQSITLADVMGKRQGM